MTKAFDRIKAGLDDIEKWKAGRSKATIFFNGEYHRMTYSQHKALLLGQKAGLAAGFKAGLEAAAKAAEATKCYDDNLQRSAGCSTTGQRIAAAIRAQGE